MDSQIELASGECVDSVRDAERIKKTWLQPGAALGRFTLYCGQGITILKGNFGILRSNPI